MALLDQHGNPYAHNGSAGARAGFLNEYIEQMNAQRSDPAFNSPGSGPNFSQYPVPHVMSFAGLFGTLAKTYRASDEALRDSLENARFMRNDPGIMECVEHRQRASALLDWHLEPDDETSQSQKDLCEQLTTILERIPFFMQYRYNLMHAIWYGRYGIQHRYRWLNIGGKMRILPARLRDNPGWMPVNGDKLVFRYDDGTSARIPDQVGIRVGSRFHSDSLVRGTWMVKKIEPTDRGLAYFLDDWQRPLLAIHKHMIEDGAWEEGIDAGMVHGVGIRSRIYWDWYQKQQALAFMMEYLERSSGGIELWYYPMGNSNAEEATRKAATERIGNSRNIVLVPKPMGEDGHAYGVEVIEPGIQGIESLKDVLTNYFGHRIKRYILGQTLSSEADATGMGSGLAELHLDTFLSIIKFDATNLEETITEELLRHIKDWNFPDARQTNVRFVIETDTQHAQDQLAAYHSAWEMGARIKESDVLEAIGTAPPDDGDRVLQNPQIQGGPEGGPEVPGEQPYTGPSPQQLNALSEQLAEALTDVEDPTEQLSAGEQVWMEESEDFDTGERVRDERYHLSADLKSAAARTDTNPSEAQKEAGNYRKGKLRLHGLEISIENPKGSKRSGTNDSGKEWSVRMPCHYGYVRRTTGNDGDHVDLFIGPDPESELVYVVDQQFGDGKFDEHKAILGFTSERQARDAYLSSYSDDARRRILAVTPLTIGQFKAWLEHGEMGEPLSGQVSRYRRKWNPADHPRADDGKFTTPLLGYRDVETGQLRRFDDPACLRNTLKTRRAAIDRMIADGFFQDEQIEELSPLSINRKCAVELLQEFGLSKTDAQTVVDNSPSIGQSQYATRQVISAGLDHLDANPRQRESYSRRRDEFTSELYKRLKPATGQGSLWDEDDHPRENDGTFTEKGTGHVGKRKPLDEAAGSAHEDAPAGDDETTGGRLPGLFDFPDEPGDRHDGDGDRTGSQPGAGADAGTERPVPAARTKPERDLGAGNWRYPDREFVGGGLKTKFRNNLSAIKALRAIENEGRSFASAEEQEALSKFSGWGQFPQLFQLYPPDNWKKEQAELQAVLSDREFDEAKQSTGVTDYSYQTAKKATLNSHFTSPQIVDAHWRIAQKLGFDGGRFLEPSVGSGYYLGMMPEKLAKRTSVTGIELDRTTAEVAEKLYPAATIKNQGFETYQAPDGFYDLVASNVPFGDYKLHERRYNKFQAPIHDHFFLKSLDKTRPGGLVMHVTSTGTMDKSDNRIRKELESKADLVAAIRLPASTHGAAASTEVVTDLVILRKHGPNGTAPDETPGDVTSQLADKPGFTGVITDSLGRIYHFVDGKRVPGNHWTETTTVPDPDGGEPIEINQYFADNPDQILGRLDRSGTMYGPGQKNVTPPEDFDAALEGAIQRIPEGIYDPVSVRDDQFEADAQPGPEDLREGNYVVKEGALFQMSAGMLIERGDVNEADAERIAAATEIRNPLRDIIRKELAGESSEADRARLNDAYDAFVAEHGALHERANVRALHDDPDLPLLLSLEKWDAKSKTAEKADIFSQQTIRPNALPTSADSTAEAMGITLNQTGTVDVSAMSKLTGTPIDDIEDELRSSGLAFEDPETGWTDRSSYLSGNVRRKLELAKAAAENDDRFSINVKALEESLPEDIDYEEISTKLGTPWVPSEDMNSFAAKLLNTSPDQFAIQYSPELGQWTAEFSKSHRSYNIGAAASGTWGTASHSPMKILEGVMNNKVPKVYEYDSDGNRVLDVVGTDNNMEKAQQMRDEFADWLWDDDDRRERLHRYYNDNYNNIVPQEYDGSHLTFPGMVPSWDLRATAANFAWQVISRGKGILAHEVGVGKAQPLHAKILTPTGWRTMGEMKTGDEVIAGDGSATVVTGVFPQGEKEIYRVLFSDGSSTECCKEHLWQTQTYRERCQAINEPRFSKSEWSCSKPKVRELSEIMETLRAPHLNAKNHSIPVVGKVEFLSQDVPVDPYTLGALLGDGSFGSMVRLHSADPEVAGFISHNLPDNVKVTTSKRRVAVGAGCPSETRKGDCRTYSFSSIKLSGFGANKDPNPMREAIRLLGLDGRKSHNKFVPDIYKFNSPDVRLAVLQGLMDTDGTVSKTGTCVSFTSTSKQLAEDVEFLAMSLGGVISSRKSRITKYPLNGVLREGRESHTIVLRLPADVMPFRLSRKRDKVVPKSKYKPARYIVGVEPVGTKESQCIRVAHPSHLYVTDNFIVTHNTATMVASAMELRRLGLAKKPAIVALKANLEQLTTEAQELYPGARILSTAGQFTADKRKETISRMASGDYDMVIMSHDNLNMLPMSSEVQAQFIQEELTELEGVIGEAQDKDKSKKNRTVKQLEKRKAQLESKLREALDSKKDDAITFEQSGIDFLFVDESHAYKNLPVYTSMGQVSGVPTATSQRAMNMLMRTRWLQEQNNGRGVVFATGTPISNTMAEAYNLQRYIQPEELKDRGIHNFDAWANTFGEMQTKPEPDLKGGYKEKTRFSKFNNVPELMQVLRQDMDVRRVENLFNKDGSPMVPRPNRVDHMVISPSNDITEEMMASIKSRAEAVQGKQPEKGADNVLSITTAGRQGSVDPRLYGGEAFAEDHPDSKVNKMVKNVLDRYHDPETADQSQLIFSDIGVNPKKDTGFHLYQDIIDKLVAGGIPRDQIADFGRLKDKKKARLEAAAGLNSGKIKIGIGGTQTLGTGMNVQKRLGAMHHLDIPYVPTALEQRDGRGHRFGNRNKDVNVYRYVSEGTLDEMSWGIVSRKSAYIKQAVTDPTAGQRSFTEEDAQVLTPQQLMAAASGDTRMLDRVNLQHTLKQLKRSRVRHDRDQQSLTARIKNTEQDIEQSRDRAGKMKSDADHLESHPDFHMSISGRSYTERKDAQEALDRATKARAEQLASIPQWQRGRMEPQDLGEYRGMPLSHVDGGFLLEGPSGETYRTGETVKSLDYVARSIPKRIQQEKEDREKMRSDLESIRKQVGKPFSRQEQLEKTERELKELEQDLKGDRQAETEKHSRSLTSAFQRAFAERYGKIKPASGQSSFDWDEDNHPRDEDGQFASEEASEQEAADESPSIPKFSDYEEAASWMKQRIAEYPSRSDFLASDEYRIAYPEVKRVTDESNANLSRRVLNVMKEAGISKGDTVYYDAVSPWGHVEEFEGIVTIRGGFPRVKLTKGAIAAGKKSVRWNKAWRKRRSKNKHSKTDQTERYKQSGEWITIGGSPAGDKRHVGGTPVKVDPEGEIIAGPDSIEGKDLDNLGNSGGDGVGIELRQFGNRWYAMATVDGRDVTRSAATPEKARELAEREVTALGGTLREQSEGQPDQSESQPDSEPPPPPAWFRGGLSRDEFLKKRGDRESLTAPPEEETPADKYNGVVRKPDGRYVGAAQVGVDDLQVDPHRFQYKISDIDSKTGVTKELKEVSRFRPEFAGQLLVWNDPEDNQAYVVNGHHRYELAQRLGYDGDLSVFFIDARNATEARAIGALANMAEGRGTAVDAAKFMRDSGKSAADLKGEGISLKGKVAEDGTTLAKLSDAIFHKVATKQMREGRALAIGKELDDHDAQNKLFDYINQREQGGRQIPDSVVREMAREVGQTPKRSVTEKSLFGEETRDESLFLERAQLKSHLRSKLAEQARAFKAVASEQRRGTLEESGKNVIDTEFNQQAAQQASEGLFDFDREVNLKGPLSDAVNTAAEEMANDPKSKKRIQSELLGRVQSILAGPGDEAEPGGMGSRDGSGAGDAGTRVADDGGFERERIVPAAGQRAMAFNRQGLTEQFSRAFAERFRRN